MLGLDNVLFDDCMLYYGEIDTSNMDTLLETLKGKELGISDKGTSLKIEKDIRNIPFAGVKDRKIKGYERVIGVKATCEAEIIPINAELLEMSLMEKDTGCTSTKYDKYDFKDGMIADDKYKTLIVVGTLRTGDNAIAILRNTYNSTFELSTKDKDEGKIGASFEAAYDRDNMDIIPFELYIPKA